MTKELKDPFKRTIDYLRISVTDRCDLRCYYCIPKDFNEFEGKENTLTFEEITRIVKAFTELGVKRFRITGGEPLVRRELPKLISQLSSLDGVDDLSLSTNAVKLEKFADELFEKGVRRLNVSLDTLNPEKFSQITGGGKLDKVINGLIAASNAGFTPIKINMVAMKGTNDDEIIDMVEFCKQHGFALRFIETMPMGNTGREASNQYLDLDSVKAELSEHYDLIPGVLAGGGPAEYLQIAGTDMKIGFITPISQHFCETCNRVRLSADGTLYMCLGTSHSYPLRPLLRRGISNKELRDAILEAIALKPERHSFNENPEQSVRIMSLTGG
jgi:cyclic pyranopterin phosphate synthase